MDYKEKVISLINDRDLPLEIREKLKAIFPELQEKEDEKVRQWLIDWVNACNWSKQYSISKEQLLAWLEKQKPVEEVNGDDYGIDSMYHAVRILEKTLGKVEGYQSDDGILDHKAAITEVKKLAKQNRADFSSLKTWRAIADEVLTRWNGIGNYLDDAQTEQIAKIVQEKFWEMV